MFKHFVENVAMHETAKRLYEAALVLSRGEATKPGEVAAFFGVTQQLLKNWESRGISQRGMVSVCEQHAVDLRWLSSGEGSAPTQGVDAQASLPYFATTAPSASPSALEQALQLIDDVMAPLDALDRRAALSLLTIGMERPGRASSVALTLSGAIASMSSKLKAA